MFKKYQSELLLFVMFCIIGFFTVAAEANRRSELNYMLSQISLTQHSIKEKVNVIPVGHLKFTESPWIIGSTKTWAILNGYAAATDCDPLRQVAIAYPKLKPIEAEAALRILNADTELELNIIVPTFKSEPKNLETCVGLTYDKDTLGLRNGALQLAFITAN